MVVLCYNDETIEVPQAAVKTMLEQGATCGSCDNRCCPDETGDKIDMCLNGNTINVSRNACKGITQAGGTCGPCEEETVVIVDKEEVDAPPAKVAAKAPAKVAAKAPAKAAAKAPAKAAAKAPAKAAAKTTKSDK